jgi:hypothetical protein
VPFSAPTIEGLKATPYVQLAPAASGPSQGFALETIWKSPALAPPVVALMVSEPLVWFVTEMVFVALVVPSI